MKILIVSDTHGRHSNFDYVLRTEGKIDLLIHLGDVEGEEDYITSAAECPCHLIAGNNDYFSRLPKEKEIVIGKYKIWLNHGHGYYVSMDKKILRDAARARGVDIVMFGHTHRPYINTDEMPFVMNPGSISYPRQEGRQASYIVMEIDQNGEAKFEIKDVEK
jgi:putative phosphoesterase